MTETKLMSIRMGGEEQDIIQSYLLEHPDCNASDFIKTAIRAYGSTEGGIFVRFTEVQMNTLAGMKEDGTIFSEEEFVRNCTLREIISNDSVKDSAVRSLERARIASQMK